MMIVGITGTLGAGKGTIVDYLIEKKQFKHYSVRAFLIEEIKKRGMTVDRDAMTLVANDLRSKHRPDYIVEQLYHQALNSGNNCIIESIRTPKEVETLRNKGNFYLFAVDADSKLRYNRIVLRASETDKISFVEFIANEQREMNSDDPNKQNLSKCILMADFVFNNNGSVEDLYRQVDAVIKEW